MSREIEADFKEEWDNEENQCRLCTGFSFVDGKGYCSECQGEVPSTAHCDYFQAID
ncbi:MAG: hypothetical protein WC415_05295 [Patescibacteria group bacterium]|jgi:hypothetical protein